MEAAQQPLLPGSAGFQPPKTPSMARGKLPPLPVPSLPMTKTQLGTKQDLCHPQREISVPTGHQVGIGVFLGREVLEESPEGWESPFLGQRGSCCVGTEPAPCGSLGCLVSHPGAMLEKPGLCGQGGARGRPCC